MKFITTALLFLLMAGCCKDEKCLDDTNPNCSNFNPCKTIPVRPASFTIYEPLGMVLPDSLSYLNKNIIQDGDTGILGEGYIVFSADYLNADSYEWQIGNEPTRRTGQSVDLGFGGNIERSVKITLYVKYSKNIDCFKNYNGYDTISKTIHFTDYKKHCMWGTYIGTWSHKPMQLDTFYYKTEAPSTIDQTIRGHRSTGLWGFADSTSSNPFIYITVVGGIPKFNGIYLRFGGRVYDGFMGEENISLKYRLDYNYKSKEVKITAMTWDAIRPSDHPNYKLYYFTGKKY